MIDWKWWIVMGIGFIGLVYAIKTYNLKRDKEKLESNEKTSIAILQSSYSQAENGLTCSPYYYELNKETLITEREKQRLEGHYKGYDYFKFKKVGENWFVGKIKKLFQ